MTAYDGETITYDAIGNPLTYRDGMSMLWQNGKELKRVSQDNTVINFQYDTNGLRTRKAVNVIANGSTTVTNVEYVYEDGNLLQMKHGGRILDFSYDSNGDVVSVAYRSSSTATPVYYYYGLNSHGDVVALYNASGSVTALYEYDAYGKVVSVTNSTGNEISNSSHIAILNPLRYAGYVYDNETGFYYNATRYYDPTTARFINADTTDVLTATLEASTDKNLFAYCDNNPVVRVDASGQIWETPFDIITLAISVVEVVIDPYDPLNWAGLAADAVDLIPFVTGVGEATRVVKTTCKVVDKADDVIDVAKATYKAADKASDIKKATGAYEIAFKSGNTYVGKGGFNRAITSATQKANKYGDTVTAIRWHSSVSPRNAFMDEFLLQNKWGGVLSSNPNLNTYNKIWSPGRKYFRTK